MAHLSGTAIFFTSQLLFEPRCQAEQELLLVPTLVDVRVSSGFESFVKVKAAAVNRRTPGAKLLNFVEIHA